MTTGGEGAGGWTDRLNALYTPVIADVLDRLGYRDQTFRAEIRPLFPGARAAGVARTVRTIPAPELAPAEPYKGEMAAVNALGPGDVMVVSQCDWSFWGELLSTAARYRGCRGVVIDGYTRDTRAIIAMGFPVFCRGIHPADSLGRLDVAEHDVPVRLRRRPCPSGRPDPGRRRRRRGHPAIHRRAGARPGRGEGHAARTWCARRWPRGCRSRRRSGATGCFDPRAWIGDHDADHRVSRRAGTSACGSGG